MLLIINVFKVNNLFVVLVVFLECIGKKIKDWRGRLKRLMTFNLIDNFLCLPPISTMVYHFISISTIWIQCTNASHTNSPPSSHLLVMYIVIVYTQTNNLEKALCRVLTPPRVLYFIRRRRRTHVKQWNIKSLNEIL